MCWKYVFSPQWLMFWYVTGLLASLIMTPNLEVFQQFFSGICTPCLGDYRQVFITGFSLFSFVKDHSTFFCPARNQHKCDKNGFSGNLTGVTNQNPATPKKREKRHPRWPNGQLAVSHDGLAHIEHGPGDCRWLWDLKMGQAWWDGGWGQGGGPRQEKEAKERPGPSWSEKGPGMCRTFWNWEINGILSFF